MHLKCLHYFGNESNESLLEAYGLIDKGVQLVALFFRVIEVANLSFGHIGYCRPYELAINTLVINRGVVVVAAAGNDNIDANSFSPASTPFAITVSAITDSDGKCGGCWTSYSRNFGNTYLSASSYN